MYGLVYPDRVPIYHADSHTQGLSKCRKLYMTSVRPGTTSDTDICQEVYDAMDQGTASLPRSPQQRMTLLHESHLDGPAARYWSAHYSKVGVFIRTVDV
jgi:hypothetical protein